jgi:hypothetical protein
MSMIARQAPRRPSRTPRLTAAVVATAGIVNLASVAVPVERARLHLLATCRPNSAPCSRAAWVPRAGRSDGGSKPQRHLGRLHGLLDHAEQLGGEDVQVDLLAQPGTERLNRLGRIVAAPVETLGGIVKFCGSPVRA